MSTWRRNVGRFCCALLGTAAVALVGACTPGDDGSSSAAAGRSDDRPSAGEGVQLFTIASPTEWYQHTDRDVFLGDVRGSSNGDDLSVGFARYNMGGTIAYVTYPHWFDAQRRSQHAGLLDNFHVVGPDVVDRSMGR